MAVLIPALSTCKRSMTPGEKRLGERLEQKLEDDYLIWYEPAIGPRALHPDFLVLHPRRGILVLEVKDWRLSTLHRVDKLQVELLTDQGIKKDKNPFEQGRVYAHALADLLKLDPALVASDGDYAGKLLLPWSHGVVLPNITRKQFHEAQLGEVMPPARVICGDEMTESVDAEAFQERLWNMFSVSFNRVLSLPQIDRIRWHLFPEIRLGEQRDLFVDNHNIMDIPDFLKLMDLQQEQLARSLGDGHRVIHGVAGIDQQMVMVGHQAAGMAIPVEALARCVQDIEKRLAITPIKVDISPGIATRSDMRKRPGTLNTHRSGHDNTSPDRQENSKHNKTLAARHRSVGDDNPCKQSRQHHVRIWEMGDIAPFPFLSFLPHVAFPLFYESGLIPRR